MNIDKAEVGKRWEAADILGKMMHFIGRMKRICYFLEQTKLGIFKPKGDSDLSLIQSHVLL